MCITRAFRIVDRVARIVYFLRSIYTAFLAPPVVFAVPVRVIVMLFLYRKEQGQKRIPVAFDWFVTYPL